MLNALGPAPLRPSVRMPMLAALSNAMLLRRVGFALFALSFITPNWRFEGCGAQMFLAAPYWASVLILDGDVFRDWHATILVIGFVIGWLSNFTVFFPRSLPVTVLAIAA